MKEANDKAIHPARETVIGSTTNNGARDKAIDLALAAIDK